jgi:archaemetzincin
MSKIILVSLSEIDEHIVDVLKRSLEQTFNRQVETRSAIRSLDYAYNSLRNQYISPRMIARLRQIKKSPGDKVLGIADVDLYSPDFEFVFGEAEISSGVATVSLHRLRPEHYGLPPDTKTLEDRAIKESIHELGHLYELGHCSDSKCAMRFCTSIGAVDKKGGTFCSRCYEELREN